jgi:ankyrin repeat protein
MTRSSFNNTAGPAKTPEQLGQELLTAMSRRNRNGKEEALALIWSGKASLEERNDLGFTPLMFAAQHHLLSCLDALIIAGAKLDEKDDCGATALLMAAESHGGEDGVRRLIEARASLDEQDEEGMTALMRAAENGNDASVKILIEAGADIEKTEENGYTALMIAEDEWAASEEGFEENEDEDQLVYNADEGGVKSLRLLRQAQAVIDSERAKQEAIKKQEQDRQDFVASRQQQVRERPRVRLKA